MEEAFLALLLANGAVNGALGTRINWMRRPQEDTGHPYCILTRIGGDRDNHLKGDSGLVNSRVQVDVYGLDYTTSKAATRAVIAVLSGYQGTVSGINFQGIFIDSERDFVDEDNDANNRLYRVSVDALIWHTDN